MTILVCLLASGSAGADDCANLDCHNSLSVVENPDAVADHAECFSCHDTTDKAHPGPGGTTLVEQGAALCLACHETGTGIRNQHPALEEDDCLVCHDPHAAGRFFLKSADNMTDLCAECHDLKMVEKYRHGPYAFGACGECHDPHGSDRASLLKSDPLHTCLRCHAEMAVTDQAGMTIHGPLQEDGCTSCHDPHASQVRKLLLEKMPDLCEGCHDDVVDDAKRSRVRHAAVFRTDGCGTCHTAHFSKNRALLYDSESSVCLACHGEDDFSRSDALRNVKNEVSVRKHLHGPVAEQKCSVCHLPHGSEFTRLLKADYPGDIYNAYSKGDYDFCLRCHQKRMLDFAETTIYTKFRNGKKNLHFVHVADKRKGRTCRTCHEPHGSDLPRLINSEGVAFGEWKIPIRYQVTENGGRCIPGCHQEFAYDRLQPVSYDTESR